MLRKLWYIYCTKYVYQLKLYISNVINFHQIMEKTSAQTRKEHLWWWSISTCRQGNLALLIKDNLWCSMCIMSCHEKMFYCHGRKPLCRLVTKQMIIKHPRDRHVIVVTSTWTQIALLMKYRQMLTYNISLCYNSLSSRLLSNVYECYCVACRHTLCISY